MLQWTEHHSLSSDFWMKDAAAGLLHSLEFSSSDGDTAAQHNHIHKEMDYHTDQWTDRPGKHRWSACHSHTLTKRALPPFTLSSHFVYILVPPGCPSVSVLSTTLICSFEQRFKRRQFEPLPWCRLCNDNVLEYIFTVMNIEHWVKPLWFGQRHSLDLVIST